MAGETILVVDDHDDLREFLDELLRRAGYQVLQACDGLQGLQCACNQSPDLIFADLNMPRMNGFDMLRGLRQQGCEIPVVMMTFHGSEDVAVEAFRLGVRDYLPKPFAVEDALRVVEHALREKRFAREREQIRRELWAAESARASVVTLAHYLNNYLTIISTGLGLLDETLREKHPDPRLLKIICSGLESAVGIEAVINVLRQATNLQLTDYHADTPMLNIDDALKKEILRLSRR